MRIAIYPGTFDPITRGHTDIVRRSLGLFDRLIVAVAPNLRKEPLLSLTDRVTLAKTAMKPFPNVEVEPFEELLVSYVQRRGAHAIVRGLRAVSDFEHEFQMALLNRKIDDRLETVFLMPSEEYSYLTSSIVKELAMFGGSLEAFLIPEVAAHLRTVYERPAS